MSRAQAKAAFTAVGLTVVAVVVAMAARAPLSGSTPVDARAAQAPTTAVAMLVAGAGIVMLGALAVISWSGRRRKDDPPEHEPPPLEVPWIWKLVATLVPLALGAVLVAAAVIGAGTVHGGGPSGGSRFGSALRNPTRPGRTAGGGGFVVPGWLPWTVLGIVVLGVVLGAVVLVMRRERPEVSTADSTAARAAVQAALGALDTDGDPRRAVIAAYLAMQRTLAEHGVTRSAAEAPREYLRRVLVESSASEREARTLTGLFEEARYSTHPVSEGVRERALSALRSLQDRLRAEEADRLRAEGAGRLEAAGAR